MMVYQKTIIARSAQAEAKGLLWYDLWLTFDNAPLVYHTGATIWRQSMATCYQELL